MATTYFSRSAEFPEEINVTHLGERATLTPTSLLMGDAAGTHVSITPTVCTIQSKEGSQAAESIALTSQNVTTTTPLGTVRLAWAQIGAALSAPAVPTGGTTGQVLARGAGSSLVWNTPSASSLEGDLDMQGNDIINSGSITVNDGKTISIDGTNKISMDANGFQITSATNRTSALSGGILTLQDESPKTLSINSSNMVINSRPGFENSVLTIKSGFMDWHLPEFVATATDNLNMRTHNIAGSGTVTMGDPEATHSVISSSSLSHTKISEADTYTVTITGESLGLTKNSDTTTFPWQDLVTAISTPPTLEAIIGVNNFTYLRLLGSGQMTTQMTTKMNFSEGSFSFEKIVDGVKTVGGLFPNGITYSSGPSTGSLATTLTLSLKENGSLLLADAHRTFFGGLESVILDSNGTYTIPANINLNFTITIHPVVKNIIANDLQLGQIINIYNYGDANNKINNYSMGTNKLITCYYDGVLLNCSTSDLVSVTYPYEGTSYEC